MLVIAERVDVEEVANIDVALAELVDFAAAVCALALRIVVDL